MEKLFIGAVLILVSVKSLAVEKCYTAVNPESIVISKYNEDDGKPSLRETAKAAQVKLQTEPTEVHEDGSAYTQSPWLALEARSSSMTFSTFATQISVGNGKFNVDCDGGHVSAQLVKGVLVLNTERLDGNVAMPGSEGCAQGSVAFKNLQLVETNPCQ